MAYQGDIKLGNTLYFHFTTRQISGAPSTLASSPVLSAYPQDSLTQLTAGITLSVDFDSVTGLNSVKIVASGGNGYATATDYSVVITTGTVNSVSVVGEVVGSFSIENRRADVQFWNGTQVSNPATAGIPDVNVKNMNNVAGTAITTIKAVQGLAVDGVIPTATNLTNAPTNGDFTGTMKTSLVTAGNAVTLDSANFTAAAENAFADALLDRANAIETAITPRLALRYISAALAGVLSGAATTTVTILGANVGTTRITATVDASGNRSAITLT